MSLGNLGNSAKLQNIAKRPKFPNLSKLTLFYFKYDKSSIAI